MPRNLLNKIVISSLVTAALLCADALEFAPMQIESAPLKSNELDAPESVEIFTGEQIRAAHALSLYAFINTHSSVFALPSYGNPVTQKLDLHGYGIGDGYQNIVITLNGRRLNNVDLVPQLLSAIAPDAIERIEIIKGSGIVTGGDGANAGAIHITTRQDDGASVMAYAGFYSTFGGALQAAHVDNDYRLSASGEVFRTAGTRHINALMDRDEQKLGNGRVDLAVMPFDALELRLGAMASRSDVTYGGHLTQDEYDDQPSQPGSTNFGATRQEYDSDAYDAGITYTPTSQLSLNVDAFKEKKKQYYVTYLTTAHYEYDSLRASADYNDDAVSATLGTQFFDGKRQQGATAFAARNETTKQNLAGYVQAQYRNGGHTLKGGYRYEKVDYDYASPGKSLNENHTLHGAEAGYNYQYDNKQSVFASYQRGFQAPGIDRFFAPDFSTTPAGSKFNGFIQPMKTNTFTLGYNRFTDVYRFKISAYYVDLQNEIYYYADPAFIASVNTNIDRSHKWGIDLYDKWMITDQFHAMLNYNYVDAVIDEEKQNGEDFKNKKLPGVANHTVKASLMFFPSKAFSVTFTQLYRSRSYAMNDFGNRFAQRQQEIASTDVGANYERDNYALFFKINNLTNRANGLWISDDVIYPVNFTTTATAGLKLVF